MAERLKAPASKAGRDLRPSRVRISLSPPLFSNFSKIKKLYLLIEVCYNIKAVQYCVNILWRDGRVVEGARLERV